MCPSSVVCHCSKGPIHPPLGVVVTPKELFRSNNLVAGHLGDQLLAGHLQRLDDGIVDEGAEEAHVEGLHDALGGVDGQLINRKDKKITDKYFLKYG